MTSSETLQLVEYYNKGLAKYKECEWGNAISFFKQALEINPQDGPSKLYVERCEYFIANPPPADWDGVFTMTSK